MLIKILVKYFLKEYYLKIHFVPNFVKKFSILEIFYSKIVRNFLFLFILILYIYYIYFYLVYNYIFIILYFIYFILDIN